MGDGSTKRSVYAASKGTDMISMAPYGPEQVTLVYVLKTEDQLNSGSTTRSFYSGVYPKDINEYHHRQAWAVVPKNFLCMESS